MIGIDISNRKEKYTTHCNNCNQIINSINKDGLEALDKIAISPCLYNVDNFERYLLRCIYEAYSDKHKCYIKPTILSDGRFDHYNNKYSNDYALESFVVSGDSNVLLVNGEAGIGKSSFMNELFLATALYSLNHEGCILPLFFRGEDFGSDNKKPDEWVSGILQEQYHFLDFSPAFYNPKVCAVFFIDAINDIQYTNYADFYKKLDMWQTYIENLLGHYRNAKVVISSRYLEYLSNFEIRNYTRLFIQPLDNGQVEKFVDFSSLSPEKKRRIIKLIISNRDMPFLRIPFFLNKILSSPVDNLQNKTEVINTFVNSIFQKSSSFVRVNKETYVEFGKKVTDVKLNGTTFFKALEKLAYDCQSAGTLEFGDAEIEAIVHKDSEHFRDNAINNSILTKEGNKFAHSIFQEYFSGRRIAKNLGERYGISDLLVFDSQVHLKQSLKHTYNLIQSKEYFIKILLDANKYELAAECVLENKDEQMRRLVASKIVVALKGKELSPETNNLGLLLGNLGDIRFPIDSTNNYEPPMVYIERLKIHVGKFPITNREYMFFVNDNGYQNPDFWPAPADEWFNREQKIQSICSFWYDIQTKLNSNQEKFFDFCFSNRFDKELIANLVFFKAITKDDLESIVRDLYNEEKDSVPLMWGNPVYSNPSQPVVGISWFEAFAYCNWLSSKTGKRYRLLSNDEWENVAFCNRRTYIYGNRYNKGYSNTVETNLKQITAVGICSDNCTPDGVMDLSGNIFEWTNSIYNMSQRGALYTQYICKGGSWIQDADRAISKYVGRGMAWVRNIDLGFRVCIDEN